MTNELFDRIIDVKLYTTEFVDAKSVLNAKPVRTTTGPQLPSKYYPMSTGATGSVISLSTPGSGVKPDILFKVNQIPGSACYNARLTIKNFSLQRGLDIRKFCQMVVTVGYRTGQQRTFTCPIFSAYQASPNPGGETVFLGLTVGELGALLTTKSSYRIRINKEEMTVGDLLQDVVGNVLGYTVTSARGVPTSILSVSIPTKGITIQSEYALGVVNWLAQYIHEWGTKQDPAVYISLLLQDDECCLIGSDVELGYERIEPCVNLRLVKSASFTGPALTVIAPYDPNMVPGMLFTMPITYYSGDSLPNAGLSYSDIGVITTISGIRVGLFRALTVELSFGTYRNNQMTILAVPASSTDPEAQSDPNWNIGTEQDIIDRMLAKQLAVDVIIGNPPPKSEEDVPSQDMWSTAWSDPGATTQYLIKAGDTLSELARQWYGTTKYVWDRVKKSRFPDDVKLHFPSGIEYYYFFPAIMISTYKASLTASDAALYNYNSASSDGREHLDNPDALTVGRYLVYPSITSSVIDSMVGNSTYATYFSLVAKFYEKLGKQDYQYHMEDIANYLKYGA